MSASEPDDADMEWTDEVWTRARPASEVHGAVFAASLVRPSLIRADDIAHRLPSILQRQSALAGIRTNGLPNVVRT